MDKHAYLYAIAPAMDIVTKKHEDYNTGISLEDYFPFGDASYVQMLHVKVLRLRSLVERGADANFESMLGTVYDLINYGVFFAKHLQKRDTSEN